MLDAFDPAPAELIAARTLQRRVDAKFAFPAALLEDLPRRVAGAYAILVSDGGSRAGGYASVYLDTPELRCFHDHRRGLRTRHKVRFRHYLDRQLSFLEVKTRHSGLVTHKLRLDQVFGNDNLGPRELEFVAASSPLAAETLMPQVWTRFRRITLLGKEVMERVTIDLELEVGRGDARTRLDRLAIVEVKQPARSARSPMMLALRELGQRPLSISKYCVGLALMDERLRSSRLQPALRVIERIAA